MPPTMVYEKVIYHEKMRPAERRAEDADQATSIGATS